MHIFNFNYIYSPSFHSKASARATIKQAYAQMQCSIVYNIVQSFD